MDSGPVSTFQVHEYLRPKVNSSPKTYLSNSCCYIFVIELMILYNYYVQLCDLYENDSIFDKFECCLSGDGQRVATGSYRSTTTFFSVIAITASFTMHLKSIYMISAIYSEFLDLLRAVLKQLLWKLAKIP